MRLWAILVLLSSVGIARPADYWLFASFRDPGTEGVKFLLSEDGYWWEHLAGGRPLVTPEFENERMRDPFLTRGPAGAFHMVWTWGGTPLGIGYARSDDLVNWSPQKRIPILPGEPDARNAWAPEIYWDETKQRWLIIWSSTVPGKFPETDGQVENGMNHRIYSMTTPDFETFSEPRLFFDPGYPVIDATLLQRGDRWHIIFKDERRHPLHKQLRIAAGPSIEGPWSGMTEPITGPWTEGPSVVKIGEEYLIYYDCYRYRKYFGAVRSLDFTEWEDVSDLMGVPPRTKHGSFVRITAEEAERLSALAP